MCAEEFNISLLTGLAAENIGNDTKYFQAHVGGKEDLGH